jgi:hypothetical protein
LQIRERCRVIIDNDWSGDPDGLVALAHHLLSPSNRVVAVTSSFLNPMFQSPVSKAEDGAEMARELISLVGLSTPLEVHAGQNTAFAEDTLDSPAATSIIAEARKVDPLPLFLVCAGPLTNVAAAFTQAPDIVASMILVWVGGASTPDAAEYNRDTDRQAADLVLSRPDLTLWQFPLETYRACAYSVAELEQDLRGSGQLGQWLWDRFTTLSLPDWISLPESWPLGDSPPILVTALGDESSGFLPSPIGQETSRTYTEVDFRLIVGDMLAKLRQHERRRGTAGQ